MEEKKLLKNTYLPVKHICEDFSKMSAGLRTVIGDLNNQLNNQGIDSRILSTLCEKDDDIELCPRDWPKGIWNHADSMKHYLEDQDNIIFHIHGVWMYPQYIASKIALLKDIPSILSPHGMLQPWLWEQGTMKKKIYFNLLVKKYFEHTTLIHAITPEEKENLFQQLRHKNIEVIPNSISYKEIESYKIQREENEKYILFVGRLHSVKGIDLLIKAFSQLPTKHIKLKIAGPFTPYKGELDRLVKELRLENKVEFLGMVSGKEKYQLYKNAWVFVSPSHSEVIGMVNLEAGILGTPVITTYQTGLYREWQDNGGLLINPNEKELQKSLNTAIHWSEEERNERGKKLRDFIIEHYSWENNISRWKNLYKSVETCKH